MRYLNGDRKLLFCCHKQNVFYLLPPQRKMQLTDQREVKAGMARAKAQGKGKADIQTLLHIAKLHQILELQKTGLSMNQIVSGPELLTEQCIIIWLRKKNNPEPCDCRRYFRSICNENLKLANPLFTHI